MIYINKNREPQKLLHYRKTKDAHYDNMPTDVKDELRESLMKEQGYICAYCMKQLNNNKFVKIEHIKPRNPKDNSGNAKDTLDYKNMVAVCDGNKGAPLKNTTCDTHRGNTEFKKLTPFKKEIIDKIKYRHNGEIFSEDIEINEDLNERLNLNCSAVSLPECRAAALNHLIKELSSEKERGNWNINMLKKYRKKYEQLHNGRYTPYLGIILWYLDLRIKKFR